MQQIYTISFNVIKKVGSDVPSDPTFELFIYANKCHQEVCEHV